MKMDEAAITELFSDGLGARSIAKRLGYEHHVSVTKVLKKRGLIRKRNQHLTHDGELGLSFVVQPNKLRIASEHLAKHIFVIAGYTVFTPEPGAPCDLLVEIDGSFKKIQVKSSTNEADSGNYVFSLSKTRNNSSVSRIVFHTENECDYFFLLDLKLNSWLVPFNLLQNKRAVVPRLRFPGYEIKFLGV